TALMKRSVLPQRRASALPPGHSRPSRDAAATAWARVRSRPGNVVNERVRAARSLATPHDLVPGTADARFPQVRIAVRTSWLIGVVCGLWAWTAPARAAPPEPQGPHPRMLLDADLRAAWRARSKQGHGPIVGAIQVCDGDRSSPREHAGALYMGSE